MDFEMQRQIAHVGVGTTLLLLIYYDLFIVPVFAGVLALGAVLSLISRHHDLPGIAGMLDWLERDEDRYRFPGKGALFLLAGVLAAVMLFEPRIAMAATIAVTVGDSVTHLVGQYRGLRTHPLNAKKALEGFVAGTVCCFLALLLVLPVSAALVVAVSAMLFESLDHRLENNLLDDNLTVPLVAGISYYGFTALTAIILQLL